MIEKCADIIVNWLMSNEMVKEKDKELYSYAVYSFCLFLSPLLLAIGIGLCMGCVRQSMVVVLPFMIIRKFSGGYHTKHPWSCLLWSCSLLVLCNVISFYAKCGWLLAFLTMAAAVSLICSSPIDNENRRLTQDEYSCYKRITAILVVGFLIVDILLYVCQLYTYSVCISIGVMLTAMLQLPCIFWRMIKKMR